MKYLHPVTNEYHQVHHRRPKLESNTYLVKAIDGDESTCHVAYSFVVIATDEKDAIARVKSNCAEVVINFSKHACKHMSTSEINYANRRMYKILDGGMKFSVIHLNQNRCYPVSYFDDSRSIIS